MYLGYRTEGILFTDQYQLTMAQLYYRMGLHDRYAQFDHFFRSYPDYGTHKAGYCISAGLEWLLDWMGQSRFGREDIRLLREQKSQTGRRLFEEDFLLWLGKNGSFDRISLRAVPEGRVVHAGAPLTVVEGPLAMSQILETALLNCLNYQTLIATKASRVRESSRGQPVMDFGLRRAQGHGANEGTRAALIGGADFSSNVGISHRLGYPPKGTHAHSMVQTFMALGEGEINAFRAYADVYPDDCLLLVDTVNTLESGVPNAIEVFADLKRRGHKPLGIRLDSGDLAYLSIQAAKMLDAAGFEDTVIVLSNQLDELVIWQIMSQIEEESARYGVDADHLIRRLIFGVGTRLITSQGDAALDGVYKLVAIKDGDQWISAIKISESARKIINPGRKQVWRIYDQRDHAVADLICMMEEDPRSMDTIVLHHSIDDKLYRTMAQDGIRHLEPLITDVLVHGKRMGSVPTIEDMRKLRSDDMAHLDAGVKRIVNPHIYHVSLSEKLWRLKHEMVTSMEKGLGKREDIVNKQGT